jgi:hypothetical protein
MKLIKSRILVIIICLFAISCKKDKNNCVATPSVSSGSCIDTALIDQNMACTEQWEPVCGCNGVTYSNSCHATVFGGVQSYIDGECCK